MGKIIMCVLVLATTIVMANTVMVATAHAQYCQVVGCWTECHRVPGGRYCRRFCHRRCWPAPRYEPPAYVPRPEYHPPPYVQAAAAPAARFDPTVLLLVVATAAIIALVLITALASERAAIDEIHQWTDEAERDAEHAAALADRATATADEIDRYISQQLADAYERGRSLPEYRHDR